MIDIGINLINKQFKNKEKEVLQQAKNAGVERIILTGTRLINSQKSLEIAKKNPDYLTTTIGVHPHYANEFTEETVGHLEELLKHPLTVAVGECGLDFDRNFSTRDEQFYAFEKQIALAKKIKKPLFLHERSAHKEFVNIMKNHTEIASQSVVHCFTGTKEELKTYLDLGFYIGITGWVCDDKRGVALREALTYAPLDRLMIETDAPFLMPKNLKPMPNTRTNEPKYLGHIGKEIAKILKVDEETFFDTVTSTTKQFFSLN
ncbi:hydrolase TatD [Bacillus sp. M6-12]|uniref:TatD family hydrolase n=1 Tax=Bacillus sp. M6-12 TaxID=2054166 RepID=UPI000C777448|nr:TatD family hydrolase [Bacillus sp. M6-12]PLS19501.1 hydrolase TatD [Bacillus sp. M6-12]